jgi:hypothetical protein
VAALAETDDWRALGLACALGLVSALFALADSDGPQPEPIDGLNNGGAPGQAARYDSTTPPLRAAAALSANFSRLDSTDLDLP